MIVYILLAVYLFVLFVSARGSDTVDETELVLKKASPIRPWEYARAIAIISAVVTVIYLASTFIK
jgi:hypothetical protein